MNSDVATLLKDPLKGTYQAEGILCYLFRDALKVRGVTAYTWDKRARLFFEKEHNKKNMDKGNLNKALASPEFSWGTFKKAVDFLNPTGAALIIELTFQDKNTSKYSIALDPAEDESDPILNTVDSTAKFTTLLGDQKLPKNTLARLFRRILTDRVTSLSQWNLLLEKFVMDPRNAYDVNAANVGSLANSLQRDLLNDRMTWNIFRKGILLMEPIREAYTLELRWGRDRVETTHHRASLTDPAYRDELQGSS